MSDAMNDHGSPAGVPIVPGVDEPWRKNHLSCSGSGRIERNFDLKYLESLALYRDNSCR